MNGRSGKFSDQQQNSNERKERYHQLRLELTQHMQPETRHSCQEEIKRSSRLRPNYGRNSVKSPDEVGTFLARAPLSQPASVPWVTTQTRGVIPGEHYRTFSSIAVLIEPTDLDQHPR